MIFRYNFVDPNSFNNIFLLFCFVYVAHSNNINVYDFSLSSIVTVLLLVGFVVSQSTVSPDKRLQGVWEGFDELTVCFDRRCV
jgi:hypothetical protein